MERSALGEFSESVAVMLFYQIGELFQSYAVGKSRKSISDLMDIRPDSANLETADGTVSTVDPTMCHRLCAGRAPRRESSH